MHQAIKQLLLAVIATVIAVVLWLVAIGTVIWNEFTPVRGPAVNLAIALAATLSIVASRLHLDYRLRIRERDAHIGADDRHQAILEAIAHTREELEQAASAKIEAAVEAAVEQVAELLYRARWKGFAEGLQEGLPGRGQGGAEVLPMERNNGAPRPRRLTGDS